MGQIRHTSFDYILLYVIKMRFLCELCSDTIWQKCVLLILWSDALTLYCSVLQVSYTSEASELLSTITSLPRSTAARSSSDWRTQIRAGWYRELQSP